MEPQKKSTRTVSVMIGAVVILALAVVTYFSQKKSLDQTVTTTDTPIQAIPINEDVAPASTPTTTPIKSTGIYKDGTYSATGSYRSPAGIEQVAITITLKDGVIVDTTATNLAANYTSKRYEDMFIGGYKTYVVGKKISEVHLTRVSGSSLTPAGFNDALAQIEINAKA